MNDGTFDDALVDGLDEGAGLADSVAESATGLPLAAAVFVGRDAPLEAFRHYIEAPHGERVRLLVFHGPHGCGKSALMRTLYAGLQNAAPAVPHAWCNARNLVDRPQAYREVLATWRVMLQDNFALRFPRFDLCLALILAREENEDSPFFSWCPALLPVYEIAKGLLEAPNAAHEKLHSADTKSAVGLGGNFWTAPGPDGQPLINALCHRVLANDADVAAELVGFFAADFKESLWTRAGKAVGGVLFLDSFEALWPGEHSSLPELNSYVDWWLRELAAFCIACGILLVIGAREPLSWVGGDDIWSEGDLEQHELGGLSPRESQEFLARCGIGPAHPEAPSSLQRAIMRSCSTEATGGLWNQITNRQLGESLPLWLSLCADTIHNYRRAGRGEPGAAQFALVTPGQPARKLCDLFLKSLPGRDAARWLSEMALTPRCDAESAEAIRAPRDTGPFRDWERFTEYAFVEDQGDGFWRLEPVVRLELIEGRRRDETLEAHLNFFHHWSDRAEEAAAFFHQWALNPKESLEKWTALLQEALTAGETSTAPLSRARALLCWWSEVELAERDLEDVGEKLWAKAHCTLAQALHDVPFLSRATALAFSLMHFEASLSVYTSDEHPKEWVATQIRMGGVQRSLALQIADMPARQAMLRTAVERYQAALRIATPQAAPREWGEIQIQMAGAHRDLLSTDPHGTGPYDYLGRAITCYEQAMRLWARGRHPREWARIQSEMGQTYATSQAGGRLRNLEHAIECFHQALEVFTERETPPEWAEVQCHLGSVIAQLPGLARAENLRAAITCYLSALRVLDEKKSPILWAQTNLNTGLAWGDLAYETDDLSAYKNAINYINLAAASFARIGRAEAANKARATAEDIAASLRRAEGR
jgi:tetratricopeptide (TPR) repeat protein